ncbi:hypothetical protein DOY81_014426, partial [Sarcophaga bullata]
PARIANCAAVITTSKHTLWAIFPAFVAA